MNEKKRKKGLKIILLKCKIGEQIKKRKKEAVNEGFDR